ncbi:MAG: hypothetical protein M3040_10585 [Bacteroidota bacterium]|nr:hypothetical protein [Bacteroidota bacterium]
MATGESVTGKESLVKPKRDSELRDTCINCPSHNLQEPLKKISTFINIIVGTEKEKLSGKSKMLFDKVIAATDRMNLLVSDLFTLSQISNYDIGLTICRTTAENHQGTIVA